MSPSLKWRIQIKNASMKKLIILSLFLSNIFDIYIRYVKKSEIMKVSFIITNHMLIIINIS